MGESPRAAMVAAHARVRVVVFCCPHRAAAAAVTARAVELMVVEVCTAARTTGGRITASSLCVRACVLLLPPPGPTLRLPRRGWHRRAALQADDRFKALECLRAGDASTRFTTAVAALDEVGTAEPGRAARQGRGTKRPLGGPQPQDALTAHVGGAGVITEEYD